MVLGLGVEAVGAPYLKVMSCSSHSPPASQTGQSSGWLPSRSCSGAFARLRDLGGLGLDDHALGDRGGAGGLELGHLLDADDAHAAGCLQREAGVVAEGGDLDAGGLAGFNEQRARGCGEFLAVYGEVYVCHELSFALLRRSSSSTSACDGGSGRMWP